MKPIWELTSIKEAATRSDFYQFLNVGLKTLLFGAYTSAKTTYGGIVDFETSDKAKEGYPSLGQVGLPQKVNEGAPFQERPIPHSDLVEVTNYKFGEIIAVTQEMIDDDQTKQVAKMPLDLGDAHAKYEDKSVYSILINNPTIYDASSLFAVNHPGYTGGPAIAANDNIYTSVTLTANALAVALGMIALWCGHTDEDILDLAGVTVIVPASLRYTADLLTSSNFIGYGTAAGILGPAATVGQGNNPLQKLNLGVISSPRLDSSTYPLDFYIKTDFRTGIVFQWRDKLALLAEGDNSTYRFEYEKLRWKSRARFGLKVVNWRTLMKVS